MIPDTVTYFKDISYYIRILSHTSQNLHLKNVFTLVCLRGLLPHLPFKLSPCLPTVEDAASEFSSSVASSPSEQEVNTEENKQGHIRNCWNQL